MSKKTVVFVFGTRPELIKMVPLFYEARRNPGLNPVLCSTGQHRDMLQGLYEFFGIQPDVDFGLMRSGQTLASLHADILKKMEEVFKAYSPDWVVVQGDTTSAHAAAMAAFYNRIPVAHVEAGLRTYDIESPFPEEMNRRAIALVSKLHFCPTSVAALNLANEKLDPSVKVVISGNTSIDTLELAAQRLKQSHQYSETLKNDFSFLEGKKFILATVHRRENFGEAQQNILKAWLEIVKKRNVNILFPVHPNPEVRKSVEAVFGIEMGQTVFWQKDVSNSNSKNSGKIILTEPLDYPVLVHLMQKCDFVMTDSGGLQEEAPTFGKKILVLRESTERPEGITAGFSSLVGTEYQNILQSALVLLDETQHWPSGRIPENPYGDGRASERIVQSLSGGHSSTLDSDGVAVSEALRGGIPQDSPSLK